MRSGGQHDLAQRVAALELAVGGPDLGERVDARDRQLGCAASSQNVTPRPAAVPYRLNRTA
jgi:hypothetical protein